MCYWIPFGFFIRNFKVQIMINTSVQGTIKTCLTVKLLINPQKVILSDCASLTVSSYLNSYDNNNQD